MYVRMSTARTHHLHTHTHTHTHTQSTAPPRIQLLTSSELQKVSWSLSKLKSKLGLEEPVLLQGVLTQLAFDQDE